MSTKPINKLFKIIGGKPAPKGDNAFGEKGTPFVKMKDLGRAHFSNDLIDIEQKVSDEIAKANGLNLIKRGSILLPRSGSVALNHRAVLGVDAYMVSHICALEVIDEKEVNNLYAYYYLRSIKMDRISKKTTGLDAITFEDLGKIKIPLPPLDDQKRIAHLLGKVAGLIARRKNHLQQLDDLLKSVFLEMFGDPVRNEKGWDKPELSHFGKISTGNTPPRKDPSNYSSRHIEWIKTDNISADSVFISQAAEYLSETGAIKARTVTKGALLVACIAGSVESIGRAALTERTVAFNQQINAIQPKKDVNPLFLYVLFKISKAYIQSHASKGMKKILTKGDFEKITMVKPPVELQNQFSTIVEKVEGLKSRYQQSLSDLESLYGALSQKAFKGELDLSRVALSTEGSEIAEKEKIDVEEKQPMEPLFELPAPAELAVLQTAEGRKSLLGEWLTAWLEHLGGAPFTAQAFMDAARQRLWELSEDDAPDWGVAEYDELKAWLFAALEQGRLTQGYDDANNRVQITAAKG